MFLAPTAANASSVKADNSTLARSLQSTLSFPAANPAQSVSSCGSSNSVVAVSASTSAQKQDVSNHQHQHIPDVVSCGDTGNHPDHPNMSATDQQATTSSDLVSLKGSSPVNQCTTPVLAGSTASASLFSTASPSGSTSVGASSAVDVETTIPKKVSVDASQLSQPNPFSLAAKTVHVAEKRLAALSPAPPAKRARRQATPSALNMKPLKQVKLPYTVKPLSAEVSLVCVLMVACLIPYSLAVHDECVCVCVCVCVCL